MAGREDVGRMLREDEIQRMLAHGPVITVRQFNNAIDAADRRNYQTAVRWCQQGWLPCQKLNREWMIRPSELRGWTFPTHGPRGPQQKGA